jgi:hypothetical protein
MTAHGQKEIVMKQNQNRNPGMGNKGSKGQNFNPGEGRRAGQQNNAGKQNQQRSKHRAAEDEVDE